MEYVTWATITGTPSWYPLILIKSLQLNWRLGTSRFHRRVPNLQMSCSDLTKIIGYPLGSSSYGHQDNIPHSHTLSLIDDHGRAKGWLVKLSTHQGTSEVVILELPRTKLIKENDFKASLKSAILGPNLGRTCAMLKMLCKNHAAMVCIRGE